MKTRIVIWGANEKDEKILVALELIEQEDLVKIYSFPEKIVTEQFFQEMMNEWREKKEVTFPEGHTEIERPLSISESLLPEDIKVTRTDVISRAQTEWHFVVLSTKLSKAYHSELEDLKEKIENLKTYDGQLWNSLKTLWSKVQARAQDHTLFKGHFHNLRNSTNELFSRLKELRRKMDEEFTTHSKKSKDEFMKAVDEIGEKAKKGMRLQPLFDELKSLQRKFHDTKFTREDRSKVWDKIDGMFKKVKEMRFGSDANSSQSQTDRIQKRLNGLVNALNKMQNSIGRDKEELDFQNKRIEHTDGQLEAQIREAKIRMINERVESKEVKLKDMLKTKEQLEKRIEAAKKKEAENKKRDAAKKEAEARIAASMSAQTVLSEEEAEKLKKAAAEISMTKAKKTKRGSEKVASKAEPKKEDDLLSGISVTMGETLSDVVDTVKAVAEVVGGKIGEVLSDIEEEVKETIADLRDKDKEEEE